MANGMRFGWRWLWDEPFGKQFLQNRVNKLNLLEASRRSQKIFVVAVLAPNNFPCSSAISRGRCGHAWLACQIS
jgi:hypothetical protein